MTRPLHDIIAIAGDLFAEACQTLPARVFGLDVAHLCDRLSLRHERALLAALRAREYRRNRARTFGVDPAAGRPEDTAEPPPANGYY